MAEQLIESMSSDWAPGDYRDEFRDRLRKVIDKRLKSKGVVTAEESADEVPAENASTNVVDFMALLKKSLDTNKRTPAKKAAPKATKKRAPTKAAKKAPAKRSAAKSKKTSGSKSRKTG